MFSVKVDTATAKKIYPPHSKLHKVPRQVASGSNFAITFLDNKNLDLPTNKHRHPIKILKTEKEQLQQFTHLCLFHQNIFVKLREREGQGVDPGRSLKGHL